MTTLNIGVSSIEDTKQRMAAAFRGESQGCIYNFTSRADLFATLNSDRWALIEVLTGAPALDVRELARRARRDDVKGVHNDAQALVACGLIDKRADGKLHFPYDAVHVDFELRAA